MSRSEDFPDLSKARPPQAQPSALSPDDSSSHRFCLVVGDRNLHLSQYPMLVMLKAYVFRNTSDRTIKQKRTCLFGLSGMAVSLLASSLLLELLFPVL